MPRPPAAVSCPACRHDVEPTRGPNGVPTFRCPKCAHTWPATVRDLAAHELRWRRAGRDLSAAPSVMPSWAEGRMVNVPEPEIVGTPLLLWRVESGGRSSECIIGERADGCFMARVMRDGRERDRSVFATEGQAIAWALDRELELVDEGWRRIL